MKRIACLCLALLFLMVPAVNAGTLTDTEGHSCEDAVMVLSALDIVKGNENGLYEPEASLTRAEAATILLRTRGLADTMAGEKIFTDVTGAHWAYGNITTAYNLGLVNGVGDGMFEPESPVSFAEAVKMIVCNLGYGVQAEHEGGFPGGYITVAARLKLTENIEDDGSFTRGDMAQLIYDSIDVPLFERVIYTDIGGYKKTADNLLSYLNAYSLETQITATSGISLIAPPWELAEDEVIANSIIFGAGESGAEKLIGRDVKLFIEKDLHERKDTILAVVDESGKEAVTIYSDDIDRRLAPEVLVDTSGDTEYKYNIVGADVIYNGETGSFSMADVCPTDGSVTLIFGKDGKVSVVMVEDYKTYVVDSVKLSDGIVRFKGVTPYTLNLKDTAKNVTLIDSKDKTALTEQDLIEWDVLSVATSRSGNKIKAVRSVDVIDGEVTQLSDKEAVIGDNTYRISKTVIGTGLTAPTLGMSADFHLDYAGRIAVANTANAHSYKYGILVAASQTGTLMPETTVKVYTEDGVMQYYNLADKVEYNEAGRVDQQTLFARNATNELCTNGKATRQLIRYELSKDKKEITKLETSTDYKYDYDNPLRVPDFSEDYWIDEDRRGLGESGNWTSMFIGGDRRSFGGRFLMRESTKIFVLPPEDSDDSEYSMRAAAKLTHGDDGDVYTRFTLYDVDEDFLVGAAVWDLSAGGISKYPKDHTFRGIVLGMDQVMDEEGMPVNALRVFNNKGEEVSYELVDGLECMMGVALTDLDNDPYAPEENRAGTFPKRININDAKIPVTELDEGDIITFTVNQLSGQIDSMSVTYRSKYPVDTEMLINGNAIYRTSKEIVYRGGSMIRRAKIVRMGKYGPVVETYTTEWGYDSNPSSTTTGRPTDVVATRVLPKTGHIIEYDSAKNQYYEITIEDLSVGDTIVNCWGGLAQDFIILYK